ncbi:MAG: hypothetical protein CMF52_00085 [Legionellales bacterium]|nr:hypothetical protein [Legionellales bacterium]
MENVFLEETPKIMMQYKKCSQTVSEMLTDRGYENICYQPEAMKIVGEKNDHTMHVCFNKKKGLGVHDIRDILEEIKEENEADRVILVYESSVTYYAKQAIKEYNNVETFQAKRLYYNVTKHVLVPQHRVMDSEETDQFLLKHSVHLNQCPKILRTDPVAKYYGATPGELVEIKRSSPEGQSYFVYRVVE